MTSTMYQERSSGSLKPSSQKMVLALWSSSIAVALPPSFPKRKMPEGSTCRGRGRLKDSFSTRSARSQSRS